MHEAQPVRHSAFVWTMYGIGLLIALRHMHTEGEEGQALGLFGALAPGLPDRGKKGTFSFLKLL